MLPFAGAIKTLKRIQTDFVTEIVREIVKDNSNEIIDLNTKDQLFRDGVGNDDMKLEPAYSNPYKKLKEALSQPTDRVTLRLSGKFYDSFVVQIGDQSFKVNAKDEKTKWLTKRYGQKIFGLTDSNLDLFRELVVAPELIKQLRKEIKI